MQVALLQQSYQGRMNGWKAKDSSARSFGRPSSLVESKNYLSPTRGPAQPSKNDPNASKSTVNDEEEFSFAKLSSMWKQKDNQKLEITPPTPRTPLKFSAPLTSISKPSIPTPKKVTSYPLKGGPNFQRNNISHSSFQTSREFSSAAEKQEIENHMTSTDVDTSIPDEEITSTLTKIQANIPVYNDNESDNSDSEVIEDLKPKQLWRKNDNLQEQTNGNRPNFMSNLPNAGSDSSDDDDNDDTHDEEDMEQIMKAQMKYGVPYHEQTVNTPDIRLKSMQKRALSNFQMKMPPRAPKKAPNPSKRIDSVQNSISTEYATSLKPKSLILDPYDALDSMSMVNSEVTVQMENKQSAKLLNAFEKKKEKIASELLEDQYDIASHIPDSAFGISAAVLQKLANSRKIGHVKESSVVHSHNADNDPKEEYDHCNVIETDSDEGQIDLSERNLKLSLDQEDDVVCKRVSKLDHEASSDVFDGLSEVMPPTFFGKSSLAPSTSIQKHKLAGTHKTTTEATVSSSASATSSKSKSSTKVISRPRQRSMERERNEDAKKKFTENLAAFAKKVTTSEPKSTAPSFHLNISTSVSTKNKGSMFNPRKSTKTALETVGEDHDGDEENDSVNGSSGPHENIIGIARLNSRDANDESVDVSDYLEVLTTPVQHETHRKSLQRGSYDSHSLNKNQDDDSSGSYKARNVSREMPTNSSDSDSKIGWVPSVLRLYKMRDFSPPKADRSPTSTMHFDEGRLQDAEVSIEDCQLRGLQSIILCRSLLFGDNVNEPSRIISDGKLEMRKSTFSKLSHFNSTNLRNRPVIQEERYSMLEKMAEIHESALKYLQEDKKDEALEVYESFFESYSNQELISYDRGSEKRIISTILYNMGIIYLALDECELALDFLKEARATFEDSDSDEHYPSDMGTIYNAIGIAQFACGEYGKALMILADSLAIRQSFDDKLGMVECLSNIGCVYFALEEMDAANGSMEEALELSRSYCKSCFKKETYKSIDIQRALSDTADVLSNMSFVCHSKYRSSGKSKYLLEEALSIYKSIEFRRDMYDSVENLIITLSSSDMCEV